MINFFDSIWRIKKGELTTQQIVLLIILLVSFMVILFFIFRLNFQNQADSELCHNSVVTRGSAVVPSDAVPLKCSREYVCITEDGTCEGLTKPEKMKVKTAEEVYFIIADKMAECWWMFGEGKVDYIGKDFFFKNNYCSICSQIWFDDSLKNINGFERGEINKDTLYDYISNEEYSEGETYSEYIFKTNNLDKLKQEASNQQGTGVTFGTIEIGKQYYVVMGITSEVTGRGWKIAVAGVTGVVGLFIPGVGWTWAGAIVGTVIVAGGEVAGQITPEIGAIPVEGDGVKNIFMAPTIVEANSEKFKALNCEEIITTN